MKRVTERLTIVSHHYSLFIYPDQGMQRFADQATLLHYLSYRIVVINSKGFVLINDLNTKT